MAKRHIIPVFIPHLGCPNGCVFCDQKKITGMGTPVTPEAVQAEIRQGLSNAKRGCELAFYGGSFTAIPVAQQEALLEAAQPWRKDGSITDIRVSTRPDAIDEDAIRRLKHYGVTTVELGCQSMDETVLFLARRGHSPEDTRRATALLKEAGISVILQMMTGLPGDSGKESRATAREIIAMKPNGVRIYPTVVLAGTELERQMQAGIYQPHTVEAAVNLCAEIYEMFLEAGIPVIRVGLNPTELLSGGGAVAGAYHPALGEMVLSRMYLRRAQALLGKQTAGAQVVFCVHPSRISVMVGQKRENLNRLKEEFSLQTIKVQGTAPELWEISLKNT